MDSDPHPFPGRFGPLRTAWDVHRAARGGLPAILHRQRLRLDRLVAFARAFSPVYRDLYGRLPDEPVVLRRLPVTTRHDLMARFDDWVTDPSVTLPAARAFTADRSLIGRRFLGRYIVFTTSGTTGQPAIFVHDAFAMDVYRALLAVRRLPSLVRPGALPAFLMRGGRTASVITTGGHFASSVIDGLVRRQHPRLYRRNVTLSLMMPLPDLVRILNGYRPAVIGSYPTALSVLAREREAGRLRIDPVLALTGAERLSPAARQRIASAFGCPVRDTYAASEFFGIAFDCRLGRHHLNADWAILEPVDDDYKPVPPGQPSRTTLLTNLANRVHPIIRYDLGDSVTELAAPCPCGSPLPAFLVEGRRDEILDLRTAEGGTVPVLPMAVETAVEAVPGVRSYQVIQAGPALLRLRLEAAPGADAAAVRDGVVSSLKRYLAEQGLGHVAIEPDDGPPRRDPEGGKLRNVFSEIEE